MKIIKNIFDSQRKHFDKRGKWEKFYPVFEATETFFFIPDHVTQKGPHVRDSLDVKRFMSFVILALMPPLFFGIYNTGYQSNLVSGLPLDFFTVFSKGLSIVLPLIIVSYAVGFFWEFLFAIIRKHPISEGLLVTGLLFPLTLPPTIPLWQAAAGISFGVVIGKEIFGGTGRNFLNPALTGRAFIFFAYPGKMSGDSVWTVMSSVKTSAVDTFSGATPLAIASITETYGNIEASLSKAGFTFSTLFWGNHTGSIGETSSFLCLIGAMILIVVGVASYKIIIGGVLGALITGGLLNLIATEASMPWLSLNPFYHLVMGGFAFGIAYMATDPVSAPGMETAKWVYGFAIGALTILIRVFNPAYPEGVMLSILFMNLFAPLLDHFEIKVRLRRRIANV
ncbi:NADH:ubiquinone reductase (Na(+)-transporting) subunit B [Desulfonema magnum]|uniref:Na(+)-translocating NADH-quinone reductase subunit B n=1 Tax=Desulfonema magnum TaxID=45655 RepID=A0A975GQG1_9BACT|nr:NADH:ubiquinone reductase (Na(+)-transporting) subunit B [Desulfonema magnum]QTA89865.1 Na(+)-translocating NADH-quinone reductase, subunit B [Desulfonema magnum]